MTAITLNSTIIKSPDQISTDLGGEAIILSFQKEEYFSLDGVGFRIWELIEEPQSVAELLSAILETYDVAPAAAERDLLAVLGVLAREGLIEVK